MTQPDFDFTPAPASLTVSPSAQAARRSGRLRVVSTISTRMAEYRDALRLHGPCTDQTLAARLGWPLSAVNARRADCGASVVATGRQRVEWASGKATSRTIWAWR